MPARAAKPIELVLPPRDAPGSVVVYVSIADEAGALQECLQFNLSYE
jgi:hypothetical protein